MPTLKEHITANYAAEIAAKDHQAIADALNVVDDVEPTVAIPIDAHQMRMWGASRRAKLKRAQTETNGGWTQEQQDLVQSVAYTIDDICASGIVGEAFTRTQVQSLIDAIKLSTEFADADEQAMFTLASRPQSWVERHYGIEKITPQKVGRVLYGGPKDDYQEVI